VFESVTEMLCDDGEWRVRRVRREVTWTSITNCAIRSLKDMSSRRSSSAPKSDEDGDHRSGQEAFMGKHEGKVRVTGGTSGIGLATAQTAS